MPHMRIVFDTNIVIDWLNGDQRAQALLLACEEPTISVITWMEVMVGAKSASLQTQTRKLLVHFERIELEPVIMEKAVNLRRDTGLKLWDAIIWATAQCKNIVLVTRNTKDFSVNSPGILVPYTLDNPL